MKEVKDMFQDQREKYDMFLDVMKDFKAQRYVCYRFNRNIYHVTDGPEHVFDSYHDLVLAELTLVVSLKGLKNYLKGTTI